MVEALLKEVVSAGRTEIILAAGEHLAGKIKAGYDIKKLFVETGEFFIDFEPQAEQLFEDLALVFSKENMTKLANEMKGDSGYTLKKRQRKHKSFIPIVSLFWDNFHFISVCHYLLIFFKLLLMLLFRQTRSQKCQIYIF